MTHSKALLLVSMEPPAGMEAEFNDWYDTEHLPERAGLPGFETALRYVCVAGWPRYLALYDLSNIEVLDDKPYQDVSGERFSPWSKRVLNRVRGQSRMAAQQVYPRQAITQRAPRLLLLRFVGLTLQHEADLVSTLRSAFSNRAGVQQLRVYREPADTGPRFLALVETHESFSHQEKTSGLGPYARHLDMINEYAPYWTRGALHGVYPES
ncbi:DUF4286 family protein [Bordetella bronchiseptica]|uniref:DUF4286 family protein n=1 Tax=Bordetella bronchiseptica TaxID=518 RepID=UPI00028B721C|nr:DUF4286 family protein [Bordetella bronchiseptica]AUL14228.1 hypothetical protein BTL45_04655 [Bordetella bronchiseptica]AWP57319.1 hypothetical protein B7P02_04650 [Bordetella bronchiseptica]AWQ04060.1 hypothetical protein B9G73_04655 [Bordetella bronchiseptica]KAK72358.1 hypothetical protein L507_0944 [Bordetella bronchiseptica CA90 BB02]KDC21679.1 hypothetical protein L542_0994 [Bordetella bronchiseptica F-1]